MPIGRSLLAWLVILMLAMANGALREAVLIPRFGTAGGLVASGLMLSALVVLVAIVLVRSTPGIGVSQGMRIGALWLGLTLAFEFGFGRLVMHRPWAELLAAYTFKDGNLWPVVLLVTLAAPAAAALAMRRPASRGV